MAAGALLSGCAEAAIVIGALLGFGLLWAGVESLERADVRRVPVELEHFELEHFELEHFELGFEDWSTQIADLSWARDASIRPHLVELSSRGDSR